MKSTDTYQIAINAFTVLDVADPITRRVDTAYNAIAAMADDLVSMDDFSLVLDKGHVAGYVTLEDFQDLSDEMTVGQFVNPINPDQIVPVSTPLLEMLPLFEKHYFFFGLHKNEITHAISFNHVDTLPTKLCLFALFMELESEMMKRLTISPEKDIGQYLHHLSDARVAKARELCKLKYKKEQPHKVLLSTTIIDKINIFFSDHDLLVCLPFKSRSEGEHFFGKVERMRNQIAHGDSILSVINNPSGLNGFINNLRPVISSISCASH